jgi:hypothetical protein
LLLLISIKVVACRLVDQALLVQLIELERSEHAQNVEYAEPLEENRDLNSSILADEVSL